jgi:hypothetical protein
VSPVWLNGAEPRLRGATIGGEPSLTGEGYLKRPPLFEAFFHVFLLLCRRPNVPRVCDRGPRGPSGARASVGIRAKGYRPGGSPLPLTRGRHITLNTH